MSISIIEATVKELDLVLPVFNEYRSFYRHPVDPKARDFLQERLEKKDSKIFMALSSNKVVGFVQLYPSFSSRGLGSIWILNDLFVKPEVRRQKLAWKLIEKSKEWAQETKAIKISLSTQISNTDAQELYKKFGFKINKSCLNY
jgi:ribosomal protein S18 acetylase RimI-like enzyme